MPKINAQRRGTNVQEECPREIPKINDQEKFPGEMPKRNAQDKYPRGMPNAGVQFEILDPFIYILDPLLNTRHNLVMTATKCIARKVQ